NQIAKITIRRGAEIFALGLLFRSQEYVIAWGWAPWSDLFRVDILNTIGMSMMLMGVLCWLVLALRSRGNSTLRLTVAAAGTATAIALLPPPWGLTGGRDWLPWPIESYINGVHTLGEPQAWLFPIFPWSAFAFAGLALGFLLQSDWARARFPSHTGWAPPPRAPIFLCALPAGWLLIQFARALDAHTGQVYPVYD